MVRINATGTATLSGGTVEVLAAPGTYAKLTQAGANVRLRLPPLPRLARSSIAKRNRAHHLAIFTGDDKNAIFCRKFWARLGQ